MMNTIEIKLPITGRADKDLFPCDFYPEAQAWRTRSTFWDDFTLGEVYGGMVGVKDTWRRAFREWRDDAKYLCELAVAVNHKCWWWYERAEAGDERAEELSRYYADRYHEAMAYAFRDGNTFTDEERNMIYEVLD